MYGISKRWSGWLMAGSASPFRHQRWSQQPGTDPTTLSEQQLPSFYSQQYSSISDLPVLSERKRTSFLVHNHGKTPVFDTVKDSQLKERSRAQSGWRRSVQESIEG